MSEKENRNAMIEKIKNPRIKKYIGILFKNSCLFAGEKKELNQSGLKTPSKIKVSNNKAGMMYLELM